MTTENKIPTKRKQYGSSKPKLPTTPMTLEQLRSYLKGIQFVGGDGWHPDQKQWEAIVGLIDTLVPEQVVVESTTQPAFHGGYGPVQQGGWGQPLVDTQVGMGSIPGGGFTTTPPVQSTPIEGGAYISEFT